MTIRALVGNGFAKLRGGRQRVILRPGTVHVKDGMCLRCNPQGTERCKLFHFPEPKRDAFGDVVEEAHRGMEALAEQKLADTERALLLAKKELLAMTRRMTLWRSHSDRIACWYVKEQREVQRLTEEATQKDETIRKLTEGMRLAIGGVTQLKVKGGAKLAKRLVQALGAACA